MTPVLKNTLLFVGVAVLITTTGFIYGWNLALTIINYGLISAIMALGVNLQWGFAGLFNIGVMGFVALGGLAAVLISMPVTPGTWSAGGGQVILGLMLGAGTIIAAILINRRMEAGRTKVLAMLAVLVGGFFLFRWMFDAGVEAIEDIDAAATGYLGGLGLPVIWSWPVGGLLAAGAAWIIGKTALGLRSDYLAIATLASPRSSLPSSRTRIGFRAGSKT